MTIEKAAAQVAAQPGLLDLIEDAAEAEELCTPEELEEAAEELREEPPEPDPESEAANPGPEKSEPWSDLAGHIRAVIEHGRKVDAEEAEVLEVLEKALRPWRGKHVNRRIEALAKAAFEGTDRHVWYSDGDSYRGLRICVEQKTRTRSSYGGPIELRLCDKKGDRRYRPEKEAAAAPRERVAKRDAQLRSDFPERVAAAIHGLYEAHRELCETAGGMLYPDSSWVHDGIGPSGALGERHRHGRRSRR